MKNTKQKSSGRLMARFLGVLLIAAGIAMSVALLSYVPTDPSLLNATSGDITNPLGLAGAMFAGTLLLTIGLGAWCFPLAALTYGIRLVINEGVERLMRRAVFLPIFAGVAAVFFAANVPGENWTNSFSLGGISGDAVLEFLLDITLVETATWALILSIGFGVLSAVIGLFSLGFTWRELRLVVWRGLRSAFILVTLIAGFIAKLFSSGATNAKTGVQQAANKRKERQEEARKKRDGMPDIQTEGHLHPQAKTPKAAGRSTLFHGIPIFKGLRKMVSSSDPEENPEAPRRVSGEESLTGYEEARTLPTTRVSARIQEAIRRKEIREEATGTPSIPRRLKVDGPEDPVVESYDDPIDNFFDITPDGHGNAFTTDPHGFEKSAPARKQPPLMSKPGGAHKTVVEHQTPKPIAQSTQAKAEAQPSLFNTPAGQSDFEAPALSLLASPTTIKRHHLSDEALEENARMLENVLDDYGVKGEISSVRPGPVVTMYELEPAPGLKASRVIGLSDDIARSMSALSARVSTVPGRNVIGIELPNDNRETVLLREILSARGYGDGNHGLPLALGKDIGGRPIIADLSRMPHLLIAGTTGSGKSVAINTMIMSLLYKLSPEECRMIMIDPKMLELSVYDGIPHLLSPVVTDPKKAVVALKWVVGEMEERYRKMSKMGVRNAAGYNTKVADALSKGENFQRTVQTGFSEETGEPIFETESITPEKMPFIVVVVDEMADLMMVAGKEIEACIQRLAQMARASGIHIIMATQRPSVDVITGTIKANFPTRISFQVTSKIDSRTILGEMGAEQLLGMGDMLYMEGGGKITRVHSPFISDEEVETIVNHLKIYGPPAYLSDVQKGSAEDQGSEIDQILGLGGNTGKDNVLYDQAVAIVAKDRKCSTSYIQRKLSIGYNKAAKIVEEMEENGVVSAANHVGKREILLPEVN